MVVYVRVCVSASACAYVWGDGGPQNNICTGANQKGNHGPSLLLVYFVAAAAPLTGLAYVLQRFQRVERSRVEQTR